MFDSSGQRFALKDLLNVPMQRVLKYPLLLKELISGTADSHKDKPGLMRAKAAIDSLAGFINDTKKDFDYLAQVMKDVLDSPPLDQFAPLLKVRCVLVTPPPHARGVFESVGHTPPWQPCKKERVKCENEMCVVVCSMWVSAHPTRA